MSAGNNITVLNVSGNFYGFGDNQKKQFGLLLKRITYEPEMIKAISGQMSTLDELVDVQCGNGFTIGLSKNGTLFGSGELKKLHLSIDDSNCFTNGLSQLL